MTQTNYFGHGVPRKVARLCGERRHNGAGGFWDILSQSSIAAFVLTSPKAGFGEAPPTSVFAARRDAKIASVATLALLAVSASPGNPTENGGSAVSYTPSVSLAFCIPSAVASMIVNSFSSIVFSILSMCWRQSLSSFCLSG